jgi:hypothetical protein
MPKIPSDTTPEERMVDLMEEDAGKGTSTEITDCAFWLDDIDQHADWYNALQAIDRDGDKAPIIRLLSTKAPPASISAHLADLLERYDLVPRRTTGPKPTATYDRSERMIDLESAVIEVSQRPRWMSREEAIKKAAVRRKIDPNTLRRL